MSYKVIAPLVQVLPASNDDFGGDGYFYHDAVIPAGWNDKRCKELVKDRMLEKVDDPKAGALAKSASKADWVAFASDDARGESKLSAEDAEALTRDELAEKFAEKS